MPSFLLVIVEIRKRQSDINSGYNFHTSPWRYSFTQYRKVDSYMIIKENVTISYVETINLGLIYGVKMELQETRLIKDLKWI